MKKDNCLKLNFTVPSGDAPLCAHAEGLHIQIDDQVLTAELFYDCNEKPLVLEAKVKQGDPVTLLVLDYRIELWVGDYLADEEWPYGAWLFFPAGGIEGDLDICIREEAYEKKVLPSVLGSFHGAEGWHPDEHIFVGDCMPFSYRDEYHVIYLKDRHHHHSKWFFGAHQWEHLSTKDFDRWDIHPTMVEIDRPIEGSICTGSWIHKDGVHYLYYTVRMADRSPAQIRRSISQDGYHYQKDDAFSFVLSQKYHGVSARDPKVILGEDGRYHMFLTTSLLVEDLGCLAHLTSSDLDTWCEEAEPIYTSDTSDQPECPDYVKFNGYYYLIFSHHGKGEYLYSEKPFTDWKKPSEPAIPCASVPKCAVWGDSLVFAGFRHLGGYGGTLTFKTATNNKNGELVF